MNSTYRITRLTVVLLMLWMAAGGSLLASVPKAAAATGAPLVSGVIRVDANANGLAESPGLAGEDDLGLPGVPVALVCVTPVTIGFGGWSATTDSLGAFDFGDGDVDLSQCIDGQVRAQINTSSVDGNIYGTQATSADNAFDRQSANVARTAVLAPTAASPVVVDGLVKPVWALDVALAPDATGWNGESVQTGTSPFNGPDGQPGQDAAANNDIVRSGDTVGYNWTLTVASDDPLADSSASAIFEQTLSLGTGAVANFATLPAMCAGTNPASQIIALPSNTPVQPMTVPPTGTTSVVLRCNLGTMGIDRAALIMPTTVWVTNFSANESTYTTTARAYGVNPSGVTTIRPSAHVKNGPIQITAVPRYDLRKGAMDRSLMTQTINGVPTLGFQLTFPITLSTDRRLGTEGLRQPITFTENMWGQYTGANSAGPSGSTISNLPWYITSCAPAKGQAPVYGKLSYNLGADRSVSDSGTCSFTRSGNDSTSNYNFTLNGIDLSGAHYPTKDTSNADLSAGPFYVASYVVSAFIPATAVDAATLPAANNAGTLDVYNLLGGFDPTGTSGASNYGNANEPGYCASGIPSSSTGAPTLSCDKMADGARSNNVAGPNNLLLGSVSGRWSKYVYGVQAAWNSNIFRLPGVLDSHDGQGLVQPGQSRAAVVTLINSGGVPLTGAGMCDVFDNRTMRISTMDKVITAAGQTGRPSVIGVPAYVLEGGTPDYSDAAAQVGYQNRWTIEYGHIDLGVDSSNNGVFDNNTNRYGGSWSTQAAARCNDPKIVWSTDPTAVPGGLDAVNVVRARTSTYEIPPTVSEALYVALEQRNTYFGGADNGKVIPSLTVAADFGQVTTREWVPNWTSERRYWPQVENAYNDGDRWSVIRAQMSLQKRTIRVDGIGSGAAGFDSTGTALAGSPIVWEVVTSLTSEARPAYDVENVVITDTLPKEVTYDEACTLRITGGTVPTSVTANPDGTTTLVWKLGTRTPNESIEPRRICTNSDPLAPNRTNVVNTAQITADDVNTLGTHSDTHAVTLEQNGELRLRKDVDHRLDLQDDDQQYTLHLKNFSDTLAIDAPTIIEVLPYDNDGTNDAGVVRDPASSFAGSSGLAGPVLAFDYGGTNAQPGTMFYTTIDPALIPQDLNHDTSPAIWSSATPADWSRVTGFKFVSSVSLAAASGGDNAGLILKYTTQQANNDPGDLYANRFTAFSRTFTNNGSYQLLTSNQTTVRVMGFSLGDLIWIDADNDGRYTPGVDSAVPEGVKVQVFAQGSGVPVATTSTDESGRWLVNDLGEGDYYAVIPASEFAPTGPLYKHAAAFHAELDPNTDQNEEVDHHAINDNGGVRTSRTIRLSATVNGSSVVGDEPLEDNVAGLIPTYGTTDGFTNFTLDMALQPAPGYSFTKTSNPASGTAVAPGQTITYTLRGTNTGLLPLDPVVIEDDLTDVLEHATLVDGSLAAALESGDQTPEAAVSNNTLMWSGALAPADAITITFKVKVKDDAKGVVIDNEAISTATPPGEWPVIDPPPGTTTHPTPAFTLRKTADPESGTEVERGDSVTYRVTATNAGETVLDPVVVTDDLSEVLNLATLDRGSLTATVDGESAPAPTLEGQTLTWAGSLDVGQSVALSYTVVVKDDAQGAIHNLATATATPPGLEPITPPETETEHPIAVPPTTTTTTTTSTSTTTPAVADTGDNSTTDAATLADTETTRPPTSDAKGVTDGRTLAFTGAEVVYLFLVALVLVVAGASLLKVRRTRSC